MSEIEQCKHIFVENIERVKSLCIVYNSLKDSEVKAKNGYKHTDILRSAVVLLHSSFEEYYRSILRFVMPKFCNENDLNNFSFVDSSGKHKEKITLGELTNYRNYTVAELINVSINEKLSYTSFNNYQDIVIWAKRIQISIDEFGNKDEMDKLISRRHKIVHEVDKEMDENKGRLKSISLDTVMKWVGIVYELVELIDREVRGLMEDETNNL